MNKKFLLYEEGEGWIVAEGGKIRRCTTYFMDATVFSEVSAEMRRQIAQRTREGSAIFLFFTPRLVKGK